MKMGLAAIAVLILLIILLTIFSFYLNETANEIISVLTQTHNDIKNKNYENAMTHFIKSKENWEKKEHIYELQIEQSALDEVNSLFSESEELLNEKMYEEYLVSSYKLCFLLNHIIAENKVNLETIF